MFEQAGVMQVDSLSELFDVASLLTFQTPPKAVGCGHRNSDALGVLTADACEANGLDVVGDPVLLDHRTDLTELAQPSKPPPTTPTVTRCWCCMCR